MMMFGSVHTRVVFMLRTTNVCILLVSNLLVMLISQCQMESTHGLLFDEFLAGTNRVHDTFPQTPRRKTLDCICGTKNYIPRVRDRHGNYHEYPWQVLLFRSSANGTTLPRLNETLGDDDYCGGSIINDRMILTSANCLWQNNLELWGSTQIKHVLSNQLHSLTNTAGLKVLLIRGYESVEELNIEEVIWLHEFALKKCVAGNSDWDIGLIKLKTPLRFSDDLRFGLRPVCLPDNNKFLNSLTGQSASVLVWTYKEGGMQAGLILPKLSLNSTFIHSFAQCRINTWDSVFSRRFLCMETMEVKDSHKGYPVLVPTKAGDSFYQVGVTAWTSDYGRVRNMLSSDVFSNIAPFLGFIESTAVEWGAEWCAREPAQELPPVSDKFNSHLLTERNQQDPSRPWLFFSSRGRRESMRCRCGEKSGLNSLEDFKGNPRWNVKILIHRGSQQQQHHCGGTIVNDRVVISAAHCFNDVRDELKSIVVELSCNEKHESMCHNKNRKVRSLVRHPDYNEGDMRHDIALLVLAEELDFSQLKGITPVCLPKTSEKLNLAKRTDAVITRWLVSDTDSEGVAWEIGASILNPVECIPILTEMSNLLTLSARGWTDYANDFQTNLCVLASANPTARVKDYFAVETDGTGLLSTRFSTEIPGDIKQQYFQVGLLASSARSLLNTVKELREYKIVDAYTEIQAHLDFIEYYSFHSGAKWCSTHSTCGTQFQKTKHSVSK